MPTKFSNLILESVHFVRVKASGCRVMVMGWSLVRGAVDNTQNWVWRHCPLKFSKFYTELCAFLIEAKLAVKDWEFWVGLGGVF